MLITAIGGGNKEQAIKATLSSLSPEDTSVLLIPTACSLQSSFDRKVAASQLFFAQLGVPTRLLHDFEERPTDTQIAHELGSASLLYTIGGNSPYMLRHMTDWNIDAAMAAHIRAGKPHAGVSAGAALPFARIHSNPSNRPSQENWDFTFLVGLGVVAGALAVHANVHEPTPDGTRADSRLEHFQANLPADVPFGLALDNGAAVILGETPQIIRTNPDARVTLIRTMDDGRIMTSVIEDPAQLPALA